MIVARTRYSTYEIDVEGLRVRRLSGVNDPTERQGPDGEWKPVVAITRVAGRFLFHWDEEGRSTITSLIVSESDTEKTPVGATL